MMSLDKAYESGNVDLLLSFDNIRVASWNPVSFKFLLASHAYIDLNWAMLGDALSKQDFDGASLLWCLGVRKHIRTWHQKLPPRAMRWLLRRCTDMILIKSVLTCYSYYENISKPAKVGMVEWLRNNRCKKYNDSIIDYDYDDGCDGAKHIPEMVIPPREVMQRIEKKIVPYLLRAMGVTCCCGAVCGCRCICSRKTDDTLVHNNTAALNPVLLLTLGASGGIAI